MSQLNVDAIRASNGTGDAISLTASDKTCTANITNIPGRNLIINGAMQVAQRGASFTDVGEIYTLDRFRLDKSNTSAAFTITQSTTSPDGFAKSFKMDCTTADTSTAANEFVALRHKIEAQNLQNLAYGTSAAKALVLSFYVRSNVTGTYAVTCLQRDNSSKLYARTYTINSANTWERKTISIPADTSGVINDDNGSGFEIYFPLIMGSDYTTGSVSSAWETYANSKIAAQHGVNIGSSTSNEWYLTGVQLEVGDYVTDFEHRSYGDELASCQRYYYENSANMYLTKYSTGSICNVFNPVTMRANPTITQGSGFSISQISPYSFYIYKSSGDWGVAENGYEVSAEL